MEDNPDPTAPTKTGKKTWVMLENNPSVMTQLATTLGLSPALAFHDIYALDPAALAHIPRPALALLVIVPLTPAWHASRTAEDADLPETYPGAAPDEPVLWFKQTIGHACGSIGVLHSTLNGPAAAYIAPDSTLARLRDAAGPLAMHARAAMLYASAPFEAAHRSVEFAGDSEADASGERSGGHFVSFVKSGGKLWELEGSRRGPLERGELGEEEDVLSARALEMGVGRIIEMNRGSGGEGLLFSCIALARRS